MRSLAGPSRQTLMPQTCLSINAVHHGRRHVRNLRKFERRSEDRIKLQYAPGSDILQHGGPEHTRPAHSLGSRIDLVAAGQTCPRAARRHPLHDGDGATSYPLVVLHRRKIGVRQGEERVDVGITPKLVPEAAVNLAGHGRRNATYGEQTGNLGRHATLGCATRQDAVCRNMANVARRFGQTRDVNHRAYDAIAGHLPRKHTTRINFVELQALRRGGEQLEKPSGQTNECNHDHGMLSRSPFDQWCLPEQIMRLEPEEKNIHVPQVSQSISGHNVLPANGFSVAETMTRGPQCLQHSPTRQSLCCCTRPDKTCLSQPPIAPAPIHRHPPVARHT